jgi:hypothetical protein
LCDLHDHGRDHIWSFLAVPRGANGPTSSGEIPSKSRCSRVQAVEVLRLLLSIFGRPTIAGLTGGRVRVPACRWVCRRRNARTQVWRLPRGRGSAVSRWGPWSWRWRPHLWVGAGRVRPKRHGESNRRADQCPAEQQVDRGDRPDVHDPPHHAEDRRKHVEQESEDSEPLGRSHALRRETTCGQS